jgi:hypothetical protein
VEWSEIHITGTDELILHQYHGSTWEVVKDKLVLSEESRNGDLPVVDLWMVSGSLAYIGAFEERLATAPMVAWMSDGGRRLPTSVSSGCTWKRVSHAIVGGVTRATGVFGTAGVKRLEIPDDPI